MIHADPSAHPSGDDGPVSFGTVPWAAIDVGGLGAGEGARAVAAWPRARRLSRAHDVTYLNGTVAGRLLPGLLGHRTVLHVHDMVDRVPRHWHRADLVLADSEAVAGRLTGLESEVVHCPIELDVPQLPTPPWPSGDGPVVGFIGRIEPRKGPLDLAEAAPRIQAGWPGARILIIGDDPYGSDPEYAASVRATRGVEHIGWVADAAAVMGHLDVLVAPSRQEPFGTVLSEAMAAGVPVVATAVDGLPEVVTHGTDGMLVEPGDVEALADAVLAVLARRDEMGAAARIAARRYDADLYAQRVDALLRGLVEAG
jgi:glycosyltransferase involved in cell wall biosynthesis